MNPNNPKTTCGWELPTETAPPPRHPLTSLYATTSIPILSLSHPAITPIVRAVGNRPLRRSRFVLCFLQGLVSGVIDEVHPRKKNTFEWIDFSYGYGSSLRIYKAQAPFSNLPLFRYRIRWIICLLLAEDNIYRIINQHSNDGIIQLKCDLAIRD